MFVKKGKAGEFQRLLLFYITEVTIVFCGLYIELDIMFARLSNTLSRYRPNHGKSIFHVSYGRVFV